MASSPWHREAKRGAGHRRIQVPSLLGVCGSEANLHQTYLDCGELAAELPEASDEMPGSCGRDADVEVELGREMGSRVGGGNGRT